MMFTQNAPPGVLCWADLASTSAAQAKDFYAGLFGWQAVDQEANGGVFTRLQHDGADAASVYQMSRAQVAHGMPSHWTVYVMVQDIHETLRRAESLGGSVLVQPFEVTGLATIALIMDSAGAQLGLWQQTGPAQAAQLVQTAGEKHEA